MAVGTVRLGKLDSDFVYLTILINVSYNALKAFLMH